MKLSQFKEEVEGDWVDKERIKQWNLTPLEEKLIQTTKITYVVGKNSKLVPVIFPADVKEGLEIISSSVARLKANVLSSNCYLFPSTRQSEFHLSGWHGFEAYARM